jgi:hypothetical protein
MPTSLIADAKEFFPQAGGMPRRQQGVRRIDPAADTPLLRTLPEVMLKRPLFPVFPALMTL